MTDTPPEHPTPPTTTQPRLPLDPRLVTRARELATRAAAPVIDLAQRHTTVAIERASLRLAGITGTDPHRGGDVPWVNRITDTIADHCGLSGGALVPTFHALAEHDLPNLTALAEATAAGQIRYTRPTGAAAQRATDRARAAVTPRLRQLHTTRVHREQLVARHGDPPQRPWLYLIVATGDIDEDVVQARNAAHAGADIIAVIRSTGQSLLDYVPEGVTHHGFAGTFATQENFRIMRAALDDVSAEVGRYIRLTNYASGLCMPEMAVLAGLERADMMLNDCMYGILFRDINPVRTFCDQRFSRQVHAHAGIVINTGEDNYLTTDDAVDAAHTVTVSQLLNERFAHEAGLDDTLLGLGHAFEIDPQQPDQFRLELAHALLARELFPHAPLKYMPPTRHMTGDIFRGHLLDGFFNLAGAMTGQSILLVGMMTEAVVTPFLADRDLALANARYVIHAAGRLSEDFHPHPDGVIATRAHQVLADAVDLLERITDQGLLSAIGDGTFGLMQRPPDGGKGADGVIATDTDYANPASDALTATPPPPHPATATAGDTR